MILDKESWLLSLTPRSSSVNPETYETATGVKIQMQTREGGVGGKDSIKNKV